MAEQLGAPLVRKRERGKAKSDTAMSRARRDFPIARVSFALVALIIGVVVLRLVLVDDPGGGRPTADVQISSTRNVNPISEQVARPEGDAIVPPDQSATPVAGGPSFITLGDDLPSGADTAPVANAPGSDGLIVELTESTDDGPVPRIGPDGTTPFAAYARPAGATGGRPMIAIVVTGMGLSESGTLDAVAKLPGQITLAFAPYGKTLELTVGAARASGHELLLEVPLEPFDYPDNDPGPRTLLTGQQPRANLDRLFWVMARLGGYVGIINNMGARFTASGADFAPVMEELGTRGLGYVDDGSSNRSIAAQLAAANQVPFSRADLQLDDNPARGPILEALSELEASATSKGAAIGLISALPVSIDTITEWAAGLEARGFALVPVSALMKGGR